VIDGTNDGSGDRTQRTKWEDTSVSGLWTPSGASDPEPPDRDVPPDEAAAPPTEEEVAALRELHARLVATPVVDVVVNHALGIWQLALVHLGVVTPPDAAGNRPAPDLASAGFAIDALAALVDGLGERLGEHEPVLRDALAQAQMLFVEVAEAQGQGQGPPGQAQPPGR
jgi:hypothetical protein